VKNARKFSRRSLLKGSGLVIAFALPGLQRPAHAATAAEFRPSAYLRIGEDEYITVVVGVAEMGQGVHTAIPMLVAEELDADWTRVRVEQGPADAAFENPMYHIQATGASTSVNGHWDSMRKAGAAAREMLVAAAAQNWKVDPAKCRTEKGAVVHPSGKSLSYGKLVEAAARQSLPKEPKLKDPSQFRIIGQSLRRLDTPEKVNGDAKFGMDVRFPGLLTAVIAHPPTPEAKAVSVDDSNARRVNGVRQVIRIPQGVAVLADGYWFAKKGRDALHIQWDKGANASLSSERITKILTDATQRNGIMARNEGNVGLVNNGRKLEALYEAPYLAHACMEPMNATAWVKKDSVEIWASTQTPGPNRDIASKITSVDPKRVKVNTMLLGGGFGRRSAPDFVVAATLLSKISGKPVKLIYSREDDMRAYFYRPASVTRFTANLDASGRPISFTARIASSSLMDPTSQVGLPKVPPDGVDLYAIEGLKDLPYDIPNLRVEYSRQEPGVPVWFWRSVGHSQNTFFSESFIDELASTAGKDPFEFRRSLLGKQPRCKAVLELAAEKAGWAKPLPEGLHRGIAVAQSYGSYVAEVAEVSVEKSGQPKVHRVVAAVDCGQVVNPEIVKRQCESAVVFGLTAALYGKITFKNGEVEQDNFNSYRILRMDEMPKVEVYIVNSTQHPTGMGEPGLPPLAPAVTAAIFKATGKRIRKLPIDAQVLKT
jgi:isoquinoline 1-oxidoreductase subunit beta